MKQSKNMKFQMNSISFRKLSVIVTAICFYTLATGCSQETEVPVIDSANLPQKFATAEEAATTLIQASADYDIEALAKILGPEGNDLVFVGPPAEDRKVVATFSELAEEKHEIVVDPTNEHLSFLSIGQHNWPFAIPLVSEQGQWYFDAVRGKEELNLRRVGGNELDAIEVCRGYVVAQQEYAIEKHDDSIVNQYARKVISSPGKQDGLAWQNADGSWGGPVGEIAAEGIANGYQKEDPFNGYFYKVLTRQGPDAPMGEMDYMVNGAMIGGFALAATPAEYGVTGVMSFIVSNDGVVYQQDFGEDTLEAFRKLEVFNPDESWTVVPVGVN